MDENEKDYTPDLIELTDDEGNSFQFEVLDSIENEENYYIAVMPTEETIKKLNASPEDLIILKEEEENGEFFFSEIMDDDEYETVADAFSDRLAEFYEIEDK